MLTLRTDVNNTKYANVYSYFPYENRTCGDHFNPNFIYQIGQFNFSAIKKPGIDLKSLFSVSEIYVKWYQFRIQISILNYLSIEQMSIL